MSYAVRHIILFTHQLGAMRAFYRDVLGLAVVEDSDGWVDLAAGGCNIALHAAGTRPKAINGRDAPHKLVFFAADVAAARAELVSHGVAMDALKTFGDMQLCDGADADGDRIQLSNRA